jgi:putative toxin-antitoxin system antitoxin component (TIGR02293 family)
MALTGVVDMENVVAIRDYLGGAKVVGTPKKEADFVPIVRRGFPVAAIKSLSERAKLSEETIYESLRIAKRTAARRKQRAARLKPAESELLLRLARAFAAATQTLGSEEKARRWLVAANRALGGVTPISLLDTGIGFQSVIDVLGRIEYGIFS